MVIKRHWLLVRDKCYYPRTDQLWQGGEQAIRERATPAARIVLLGYLAGEKAVWTASGQQLTLNECIQGNRGFGSKFWALFKFLTKTDL